MVVCHGVLLIRIVYDATVLVAADGRLGQRGPDGVLVAEVVWRLDQLKDVLVRPGRPPRPPAQNQPVVRLALRAAGTIFPDSSRVLLTANGWIVGAFGSGWLARAVVSLVKAFVPAAVPVLL